MNIASVKWLAGVALLAGALASCSKDTVEADPYADWEVRNANYLDSIANVCANPPTSEKWEKVLNYKLAKNDLKIQFRYIIVARLSTVRYSTRVSLASGTRMLLCLLLLL